MSGETPDDELQKIVTKARRFKPQARLEPEQQHWWQTRKADVLTVTPRVTPQYTSDSWKLARSRSLSHTHTHTHTHTHKHKHTSAHKTRAHTHARTHALSHPYSDTHAHARADTLTAIYCPALCDIGNRQWCYATLRPLHTDINRQQQWQLNKSSLSVSLSLCLTHTQRAIYCPALWDVRNTQWCCATLRPLHTDINRQ